MLLKYCLCLTLVLACTVNLYAEDKTLAEALGYPPDAKVMIINADDFGMCHAENLGTKQVLEYGIVTSTTMMIPCPWALEAIEYVKKNNMTNVGVHVALTSEWKRYRWRALSFPLGKSKSSLHDDKGYMWAEGFEFETFASIEDIKKEIRAQLNKAIDSGVDISHFDSHMGSLYGIFTGRVELLAAAMACSYEFGVPYRLPYVPGVTDEFRKKGFAVLDYLDLVDFQPKDPKERREYFLNYIKNLKPGVTEIYIHPAVSNDEIQRITGSHKMRQGDVDIFTDPEIMQALKDNNVHLISFEPLKKWQREQMNWRPGLKAEDVFEEYRSMLLKATRNTPNWHTKLQACCPE